MNINLSQNTNSIVSENSKYAKYQKLFENAEEINLQDEESVLRNKSLQFKFECGAIMAKINVNINNKFGLKWHFENTTNLGFFLSSVDTYLRASGNKLLDADITKLTAEYNKLKK